MLIILAVLFVSKFRLCLIFMRNIGHYDHIFMCTEQDYESIRQPTNVPNKIQFMTSIQLPHVKKTKVGF
jgi:hypothetical protein